MVDYPPSQMKEEEKTDRIPEVQLSHDKNHQDIIPPNLFRKLWLKVTDDNGLTLHGFRRFKTTHLLNLRFLEEEIDKLDHDIYQAGLKLGYKPTPVDKLGLRHGKRDANALDAEQVITGELVLKLRDLLRQYGMSIWKRSRRILL